MKKIILLLLCFIAYNQSLVFAQPGKKITDINKGGVKTPVKTPVVTPGVIKVGEKKKFTSAGNISKEYKGSSQLAKIMASLPAKNFNIGGRNTKLKLVAVDNPMLVQAVNKTLKDGLSQKMKPIGTNDAADKYCESYQISLSAASENFDVPYSEQAAHIYPGAAYMYDEYYKNTVSPKSITWPRNPIYLQAASSSAGGEFELVQNPTQIDLNKAVGKIKYSLPETATNANTSIKMVSVFDESDFKFKVNAGGAGMGFKADGSFGIANNNKKSYFYIDIIQAFYTINAILPEGGDGTFFTELEKNKTTGALFMSSVTYGRRVIGVVETEFESQEMAASFKASYSAGFAGGYAGLEMLNGMKKEKTSVKLYYVGGQAAFISVPGATAASVQSTINNYLKNTTTQNAVPVKFCFRDMNMSGMRYESATDKFTYQQCTPKMPALNYKVTVKMVSIANETDQMEGIKFGIVQEVNFYKNNNLVDPASVICPMLNWGGFSGCPGKPAEQARTFKGTTSVDKEKAMQYSQLEMMEGGAKVELSTRYIAMFATRIAGKTNDQNINKKETVYLKDVLNSAGGGNALRKEVRINFNNRVFVLTFLIAATPI